MQARCVISLDLELLPLFFQTHSEPEMAKLAKNGSMSSKPGGPGTLNDLTLSEGNITVVALI